MDEWMPAALGLALSRHTTLLPLKSSITAVFSMTYCAARIRIAKCRETVQGLGVRTGKDVPGCSPHGLAAFVVMIHGETVLVIRCWIETRWPGERVWNPHGGPGQDQLAVRRPVVRDAGEPRCHREL